MSGLINVIPCGVAYSEMHRTGSHSSSIAVTVTSSGYKMRVILSQLTSSTAAKPGADISRNGSGKYGTPSTDSRAALRSSQSLIPKIENKEFAQQIISIRHNVAAVIHTVVLQWVQSHCVIEDNKATGLSTRKAQSLSRRTPITFREVRPRC